ncbi:MAG: glycerate kinase type-2 family protein [Gemmatimonadaceae bacterium]
MSATPAEAAREILLAAIRAVDPRVLTANALRGWRGARADPSVEVIAAGKAADAMVRGAADALGPALRGGVEISPAAGSDIPSGLGAFTGGHPLPNEEGARGARAAMHLLGQAGAGSRVLVLISGGASSLMTLPAEGIMIDDMVEMSRTLMAAGADIRELNCVRKHLDRLKGGLMARAAAGASIRALVLSDVIGDPLDVIASGPLVPDPTTYDDAVGVLRARGVWDGMPAAIRDHLLAGARGERPETPKAGDPCFASVAIEVIGNNALAVQGAATEARRRGFDVELLAEAVFGEARDAGELFARHAMQRWADRDRPRCILGGGETTVTVTGSGIGGRNLEFAAAAALTIDGVSGLAIGSIGTDGRDGPTDAAGAVVDGTTAVRARLAHMELTEHLRDNDSLRALDAAGAVVRTGQTGTNVMDVCAATIMP